MDRPGMLPGLGGPRPAIPGEQRLSYIRLLHKKVSQLANYRPIALTNTDAKIITRALDTRLRSVLAPFLCSSRKCGEIFGRLTMAALH
jgi:hypothetical protein